ncbi:Putative acyltransferase [Kitasatospora sp. MMS16-BH015]|uniref:acyltransferase family protein n=1 Tax=Kitasatospora sp. MMS16-BH015 TaxID=2018025 RepID=UPI000CA2E02C|nr:acyltransferase [Kitasatospora sp. MMS16-BH015]AUG76915.1 Putative acyltransferase [Kitasatospora sp. MMS16-BH015]
MPTRLPSLTGLRCWAALLVVLYHLSRQVGPVPWLTPVVWYGRSGVTFFFVLSGFVLAWTYHGTAAPARVFYRRRLARIWPLHALTTGISLAVYGAMGAVVPVTAGLWSLLLVHPWAREYTMGGNPAGWSLGDEGWFYLLLPALLPMVRRPVRVALLCCLLGPVLWLAGSEVADPGLRSWLLDYQPLLRTPQFLLGVALGVGLRRGLLPRLPLLPAGLAVAGFHLALVPWHTAVPDALWYGPYSAAQLLAAPLFGWLVLAAAQADLRGPTRLGARPWVRLGDWSFAWYLTHEVVIRCWLALLGRPWPAALSWAALLPLTLAVAAALYRWVERPCERLLRDAPLPHHPGRAVRQRRAAVGGGQSSIESSRLT